MEPAGSAEAAREARRLQTTAERSLIVARRALSALLFLRLLDDLLLDLFLILLLPFREGLALLVVAFLQVLELRVPGFLDLAPNSYPSGINSYLKKISKKIPCIT